MMKSSWTPQVKTRVFAAALLALSLCGAPLLGAAAERVEIFVDNSLGSDTAFDGSSAAPHGGKGPYASIKKAFQSAQTSCRITIANTGKPYQGGNSLTKAGGTKELPLEIIGNGAVISGLGEVPSGKWEKLEGNEYATPFFPMTNMLKSYDKIACWIGRPQLWFLDGVPATNCKTRGELAATQGGFMWEKKEKRLVVRLPEGKSPSNVRIQFPVHNTSICVETDNVLVRDLRSVHSWNDGFDTHGSGKGIIFRNCVATDNCGQAFSVHDTTSALYENCVGIRNSSSGVCNNLESVCVFRNCVISDNTFESGVFAPDTCVMAFENCVISGNAPFEQIWQDGKSTLIFVNCVIRGADTSKGILRMSTGRVVFDGCAISNAAFLAQFIGAADGSLTIVNCLVSGVEGPLARLPAHARPNIRATGNLFNGQPYIEKNGARVELAAWAEAHEGSTAGNSSVEDSEVVRSAPDGFITTRNPVGTLSRVEYVLPGLARELLPVGSLLLPENFHTRTKVGCDVALLPKTWDYKEENF